MQISDTELSLDGEADDGSRIQWFVSFGNPELNAGEVGVLVGWQDTADPDPEMEANLSLVCAAPDMLAALKNAAAWFRDYERQHRSKLTGEGNLKADTNAERAAFLEAAIAKASHPLTTSQQVRHG